MNMEKKLELLRPYGYDELHQGLPCCDRQGAPITSQRVIHALLAIESGYLLRVAPFDWAEDGTPVYEGAKPDTCLLEVYADGRRIACGEVPKNALSTILNSCIYAAA